MRSRRRGPPNAVYHARVLPVLSASVSVKAIKNKHEHVIAHRVTVTVTDAGDAVSGAAATVKGHKKKTNVHGMAKLTLKGPRAAMSSSRSPRPPTRSSRRT